MPPHQPTLSFAVLSLWRSSQHNARTVADFLEHSLVLDNDLHIRAGGSPLRMYASAIPKLLVFASGARDLANSDFILCAN